MVKSVKVASAKVVSTTKVKVPAPVTTGKTQPVKELVCKGKEIEYDDIHAFVRANAGGNPANVLVEPLPNVDIKSDKPVPFGYRGVKGGVRASIQNVILNGVKGNRTLKAILETCKPMPQSVKSPICLKALMNGGYSRSSQYWLTPYVKLVVKPQSK